MKNNGGRRSKIKAYEREQCTFILYNEQRTMNIEQYMLFIFSNLRHFEVSLDETKYVFQLVKFEKMGQKIFIHFFY